MNRFYTVLLLTFFILSSCSPSKKEKQKLIDQGIEIGYSNGFEDGKRKGYELGHKDAIPEGIKIGEKRGFTKGRNSKIQEMTIAGIKTNIPMIIISAISFFFFILVYSVLHKLFHKKIVSKVTKFIRDQRWDIQSRISQIKKLFVEKEKWNLRTIQIEDKIETRERQIQSNNNKIAKYTSAIQAGIPDQQLKSVTAKIDDTRAVILKQESDISKGKIHLVQIQKIQNGLDVYIYDLENSNLVDEEKYIDFNDLEEDVKTYLGMDIQDFETEFQNDFRAFNEEDFLFMHDN